MRGETAPTWIPSKHNQYFERESLAAGSSRSSDTAGATPPPPGHLGCCRSHCGRRVAHPFKLPEPPVAHRLTVANGNRRLATIRVMQHQTRHRDAVVLFAA